MNSNLSLNHLSLLDNEVKLLSKWKDPKDELSPNGGQHYLLSHIFRKHFKQKKQHEVVRLAQIIEMAF